MKDQTWAVAVRHGSSDRYEILFVSATSEYEARQRAYDANRLGSIVAVAVVPS
jgi:hypothetical protein